MEPAVNTDRAVYVPNQPRWTNVLPGSVRSTGRRLVRTSRHLYEWTRGALSAPAVTSSLKGGCGNQIFQYAAGLALARRLGVDLRLNISWYDTPREHEANRPYALGLFKEVDSPLVRSLPGRIIREHTHPYNPALLQDAPRKCSLIGFWQCEKYFFNLREELQRRLMPKVALPPFHCALERQIADAGNRSAFLHIRRTDNVGSLNHGLVPMEYYGEAAAIVAARVHDPVFFIFSDEPEWCSTNLHLPYRMIIAEDSSEKAEGPFGREDAVLWLMGRCSHAITANSSFSWWGAWMGADANGGLVIAPKSWVGPASTCDPRDIVPTRWVRL